MVPCPRSADNEWIPPPVFNAVTQEKYEGSGALLFRRSDRHETWREVYRWRRFKAKIESGKTRRRMSRRDYV